MSYDEHLISMAGGDGDVLEAIEARIRDCKSYKFGMRNADKLAHEDAPALLAMVREQRAAIERVKAELVAREARWKKAWEDGELTHEEAVSATLEDRWAYAQLADIGAAITATEATK